MLTRLEVNGFKNLVDFSLDFGPQTCIAGPYGVGKSNVFDAVNFLSLLTRYSINEAAQRVKNAGANISDAADLFCFAGGQRSSRMEFGVEMIVDRVVRDDTGREVAPSSSFLRYEVAFRYGHTTAAGGSGGGLVLEHEELRPIIEARAGRHLKFPHSKSKFRDGVVYNNRHARSGFISTQAAADAGVVAVTVHQDGRVHGRGGPSPISEATRTIVGTENTTATPTILAAKREMQNWLVLKPDPAAMRKPDPYYQTSGIAADGSHMPATLRHLSEIAIQNGSPADAAAGAIAGLLSEIVPVKTVGVVEDQVRRLLMLEIEEPSGLKLQAPSMPEGTLRYLLLAVLARHRESSVVCLEEPENGIHPAMLAGVDRLLREIAVDADEPVGADNPMRQVIVTTHSPFLVQLQREEDLVLATTRAADQPGEDPQDNLLECVPCEGTWRCSSEQQGIGFLSLQSHLMPPESAQIAFPRRFWA